MATPIGFQPIPRPSTPFFPTIQPLTGLPPASGVDPDTLARLNPTNTFTSYDQFNRYGLPVQRNQSKVQGFPVSQYGRPLGEGVRFEDVLAPTFNPPQVGRSFTGDPYLERGLTALDTGEDGIDPVTQRILSLIDERTATARTRASSEAQALAGRRGLAGSSIEQFGVQEGITGAERLGAEEVQNVLQQNIQNQLALRTAQAQGLFGFGAGEQRIGAEFGLGQLDAETRARLQAGQLTSDELASIRNIQENNMNRALQERLGAAGISQANLALSVGQTEAERDRSQSEKNAIIGGVGDIIGAVPF